MTRFLLLCFGCACVVGVSFRGSIRRVDFASHEYPWRDDQSWPKPLEWLSPSGSSRVRLVNGRWNLPESLPRTESDFNFPFAGLTLEEVIYGDLTGDSKDEAVVVLRFDSGGTQYYYWIYVYTGPAEQPNLMAYSRAGERADRGLYRVYVRDHSLVVEVYDPDERQGDCCSAGFVRYRYRWNGNAFVMLGAPQKGTPKSVSRRRVSTFGMPYDQKHR